MAVQGDKSRPRYAFLKDFRYFLYGWLSDIFILSVNLTIVSYSHTNPLSTNPSFYFQGPEDDVSRALTVIEKRRKRQLFGFAAEERRQRARTIQLAVIGQNDIIGDLEMVLDLPAYSTNVECLESLECYELDKPNFHRLIVKRNPETLEKIKYVAIEKLKYREKRLHHVPFYGLLLEHAAQQQLAGGTSAVSKASRPKSVAKALVGFMSLKKTTTRGKDIVRRLQAPMTRAYDKNAVAKVPSMTSQDGKLG